MDERRRGTLGLIWFLDPPHKRRLVRSFAAQLVASLPATVREAVELALAPTLNPTTETAGIPDDHPFWEQPLYLPVACDYDHMFQVVEQMTLGTVTMVGREELAHSVIDALASVYSTHDDPHDELAGLVETMKAGHSLARVEAASALLAWLQLHHCQRDTFERVHEFDGNHTLEDVTTVASSPLRHSAADASLDVRKSGDS